MDALNIAVIIGFLTTTLSILVKVVGFPDQIRKNYQRKSTEGVSTLFYLLSFSVYILWTIHGAFENDWVIILGQGLGIITTGAIVYQIILYRKRKDTKKQIRNNLIIELHVPDLDMVKSFYSKLGFAVTMDDVLNEKESGYLTMTRQDGLGNTMLNFYGGDEKVYDQSYFKQFPKDTKRGYATEITICTADIKEVYQKVCSQLEKYIVRELKELEDHGHIWKDFRMVDPFGFYLRFTELIDWGQK